MSRVVRISEAASLALHAMAVLAENPGRNLPVKEIAATLGVSENHLSKVLQRLVRGGFLRSVRGPSGGFSLEDGADEVNLLQVYETVEGPLAPVKCLFARPICDGRHCLLGGLLEDANRGLRDRLETTRLKDIARSGFHLGKRRTTDAKGNHQH
jgi:Rrf2 family protein